MERFERAKVALNHIKFLPLLQLKGIHSYIISLTKLKAKLFYVLQIKTPYSL